MVISKDTIKIIKDSISIVEVIGDYVKSLKKSGKNYIGLCPFHNEKHPSFSVSDELGFYKCFSCGEKGDVITFIEKIENVDFVEAVTILAKRAGIEIEVSKDDINIEYAFKDKLLVFNEKIANLFNYFLLNKEESKKCLNYLLSRGIGFEYINIFKLGYAPAEFGRLENFLKKKGYSEDFLVTTGLFSKTEHRLKTFFYDRVMFPIYNHRNECVGFGGRTLNDDVKPKYLNSPETVLYKKSNVLYGINWAKDFIKKENSVFMVEGYVDVISCYINGVKNVVSTCGTAVTKEHYKLLKRFCNEVILLLDGDEAGIKGALRAIKEGLTIDNLKLSIIILPDGMDPDDYFKKFRLEDFNVLADNRMDVFDFVVDYYKKDADIKDYNSLLFFLDNIFEYIDAVNNDLTKTLLFDRISKRININSNRIIDYYNNKNKKNVKNEKKDENIIEKKSKIYNENFNNNVRLRKELDLLIYLYIFSDSYSLLKESSFDSVFFYYDISKLLFEKAIETDFDKVLFVDSIEDPDILEYISDKFFKYDFEDNELKKAIEDLIIDIKKNYYNDEIEKINEEINYCELYNDYELIKELQYKKSNLTKKIIDLNRSK